MKRLLAVIEPVSDGGWFWELSLYDGGKVTKRCGTLDSAVEGLVRLELVALAHGFGIHWHGLVGHGTELVEQPAAEPGSSSS